MDNPANYLILLINCLTCLRVFMKSFFAMIAAFVFLCACEGNSKMKQMSNAELASKRDECLRINPSAPGKVTACENIRKECERRRSQGNYSC